jgi:hypothetical protein
MVDAWYMLVQVVIGCLVHVYYRLLQVICIVSQLIS